MAKKERDTSQGREVKQMAKDIEEMFNEFKVPVEVVEAKEGLRNFHFHLTPKKPVRMKTFGTFVDDLRFTLGTDKVEIAAPLPNTKLVGIIVPKKGAIAPQKWDSLVSEKVYKESDPLVVPLGVDECGHGNVIDLAEMPHVLIAGTTGSGKSFLLHSFICSLVKKNKTEDLRLVLVDPKRVELTPYNNLPHLMTPVLTDAKKALIALKWAVKEMERRFDVLKDTQVMNIAEYRKTKSNKEDPMPYIVYMCDEMADLMQAYPREFETAIVRLCQMGRAVGIHMILATQRPSTNVISGTIKANIPARIALKVASQVDSRTILDQTGAEKLEGAGDMMFSGTDHWQPWRLQAYYVSEDEISEIVTELSTEDDAYELDLSSVSERSDQFFGTIGDDDEEDDLYEDAKQAVIDAGKASTSYLQRKLRVGYSRTARLMDLLEERGVIGPQDGSAPREVLIKPEDE